MTEDTTSVRRGQKRKSWSILQFVDLKSQFLTNIFK